MADRLAEMHAVHGADGQQRNSKSNLTSPSTITRPPPAPVGRNPGALQLLRRADQACLAGRAHHRFDDARIADVFDRLPESRLAVGKAIAGGGQASSSPPGGGCLHGSSSGGWLRRRALRGGHGVQVRPAWRWRSLRFRNDIVRPLLFDNGFQRVTVQHIDDVAAVRHMHGGASG